MKENRTYSFYPAQKRYDVKQNIVLNDVINKTEIKNKEKDDKKYMMLLPKLILTKKFRWYTDYHVVSRMIEQKQVHLRRHLFRYLTKK